MTGYIIFKPGYPGFVWARVTRNGQADNPDVQAMIDDMREGNYVNDEFDLLCVPEIRNSSGLLTAKKKDCMKLGKLFAPRKDRGSNVGLTTISPENRYKGKVDWESNRSKIREMLDIGKSVSDVARHFGVSPSTLSHANKRHNLYTTKKSPCK
mgnify:CR=1 FL=1